LKPLPKKFPSADESSDSRQDIPFQIKLFERAKMEPKCQLNKNMAGQRAVEFDLSFKKQLVRKLIQAWTTIPKWHILTLV
jgi:hypothetical protein